MIARAIALAAALFASGAAALDEPRWPPPQAVQERMRELQQVIGARDSTPAERDAARRELAKALRSPSAKAAPSEGSAPARAAIQPYPSIPAPQLKLPTRPVDPSGVARLEVVPPSHAIVNPGTGSVVAPVGNTVIDLRTGSVLQETPSGYVDPRNGRLIPK